MKRFSLILALLVLFAAGLCPPVARGQIDPRAVEMHTGVAANAETLDLNVLFTMLDSNGQALPKEAINFEGEGSAFGPTFQAAPAQVQDATTPIRIALVIDASGSMKAEINDVRNAAINFVRKVPGNAEVAVYQFSDEPQLVQGFAKKDQLGLVETAILSITTRAENTGNTCIFRAALEGIKLANSGVDQNTVARPAVVLFTDGKDSEAGDCGPIKEDQVVTQAQQAGVIPTQVYTIGLCNDDACANVNINALTTLATRTFAATKTGKLDQLENLFNAILATLNSQFQVTTSIKPALGTNQVTFSFDKATVNGVPSPISFTTPFESPRDYGAPAANVVIDNRTFDADTNEYTVNIKVTNPEQVGRIVVRVRDASNNTLDRIEVTEGIQAEMQVKHGARDLDAGEDFATEVSAFNIEGKEILSADGKTLLATLPGKFQPNVTTPLSFEFALPPAFDWDTGEFVIKLNQVQNEAQAKLLYSGSITEDNTPVMEIPEGVFTDGTDIRVKLTPEEAAEIEDANAAKKYNIRLTLSDPAGGFTSTKDSPTTVPPRPQVSFLSRIMLTIRNPVVLGSILVIVVMIAAVALVLATRRSRREIPLPSPFNEATGVAPSGSWQASTPGKAAVSKPAPAKPVAPSKAPAPAVSKPPAAASRPAPVADRASTPNPALRPASGSFAGQATQIGDAAEPTEPEVLITIVSTPEPSLNQGRVARELPVVIGRENCPVIISGDRKISRQHAEISVQGTKIVIKDLDSANGTALVVADPPGQTSNFTVRKQFERGSAVEWDNHSMLRLGPNTVLRLMVPNWPPKDDGSHTLIDDGQDNRTQIAG